MKRRVSVRRLCKHSLLKSIQSIPQNGLDHQPLPQEAKCIPLPQIHEFVRGKEYYSIDEEGEKNVIESNH